MPPLYERFTIDSIRNFYKQVILNITFSFLKSMVCYDIMNLQLNKLYMNSMEVQHESFIYSERRRL